MALLPLNPDGLEKKLKQLYRLHAPDRDLVANVIVDDFKSYITDNFLVSPEESHQLAKIDDLLCTYLATQFALCIKFKLPIEIHQQDAPEEQGYHTQKILANKILLSVDAANGEIIAEGKLKLNIMHNFIN